MSNLRRRLELLEARLITEPIILQMPDGRTETPPGGRKRVCELLARACQGERTPEMELIAQSISSSEPGGGHMIELVRALLNGPQ
jgi:hypothetical protein